MSRTRARSTGLRWLAGVLLPFAGASDPAQARWDPSGIGLERPRLRYRPGQEALHRERVVREPYRTLVLDMVARAALADAYALDDESKQANRFRARAVWHGRFLRARFAILTLTWSPSPTV